MKTLSQYKSEYKSRKTAKGKTSVFNKAMLNLSYANQQKFISWHNKLEEEDQLSELPAGYVQYE